MSDVRINPLFAGSGMARLIRETAGRFMRTGIALRICNLVDADEPSLKEDDVCGVQARRFHGWRRESGRRRNGGRLYPRRLNARPFDAEHRKQALGNLVALLDEVKERDAGIDALDLQQLVKHFSQGQSCIPELHWAHVAQRRMHPLLVAPPNV